MSELGTARDTNANTVFLVWNNGGYREIETSMTAAGVSPVGVTPTPHLKSMPRPCLIEIHCP